MAEYKYSPIAVVREYDPFVPYDSIEVSLEISTSNPADDAALA